ncbi:tumor necrosis factor ligand superfamily member 10 [Elysia marginata]|uniref:Tumor necrosis factor ligand superfamily member 10 n=1 Tax=Elysia marginata TaxID=1093978 RepID=A0AAV4F2F9_9GAST|nr:tumor necrosis factor ligand superfamily member 10 [Elysia marginata]
MCERSDILSCLYVRQRHLNIRLSPESSSGLRVFGSTGAALWIIFSIFKSRVRGTKQTMCGPVYEMVCEKVPDSDSYRESGHTRPTHRDKAGHTSCLAVSLSACTLVLVIIWIITTCAVINTTQTRQALVVKGDSANKTRNVTPFTCVPCLTLQRDPKGDIGDDPLLGKLTIEMHDGREDCCAYDSDQIAALFQSVARLNELPDPPVVRYNASEFQFSPVSAHKRIYPARLSRHFGIPRIPKRPPLCEFKADDPRYGVEHHRGVDVLKRGMRIRHGGLYYIYTSIYFRPQSVRPCGEFKYQVWLAASTVTDRLCSLAVKTLAQRSGGTGSIPGLVKPRTLKLILVADPPGVWHYGFSAKSGRLSVRIM